MSRKRNKPRRASNAEILATYDAFNTDDISTEMLFALVCEACNCDSSDIGDALWERKTLQQSSEGGEG